MTGVRSTDVDGQRARWNEPSAGRDGIGRSGCRARPEPILLVESFLDRHPGEFRPGEMADALAGALPEAVVVEVVAYLRATGRPAIDDDGRLVRR